MSDESMWGTVASWLWTQRKEVLQSLKDLYSWYRGTAERKDSGRGIVILGAGGTGKSTLGRLLAGEYNPILDAVGPYEESIGVEEFALDDDPNMEVVVPPGQSQRRDATWDELLAAIARGEYRGVILVSAYGFHSLGDIAVSQTTTTTPDPSAPLNTHPSPFIEEYCGKRQNEELQVLRRVAPQLGRSGKRTWLISVVTKRDLWWPQRDKVEYYYGSGAYGELIAELAASVDRRLFRHELVFLSLTINRFQTARNELLLDNAAGYDHPLHFQSQRRLFETLAALREWENST